MHWQKAYPYAELVDVNGRRSKQEPEYELLDTGVFEGNAYFDACVEYAKVSPEDLCIRITVTNHGDSDAPITILPTLWLRNTWSWTSKPAPGTICRQSDGVLRLEHPGCGQRWLSCEALAGKAPELLFTNNETNFKRIDGTDNPSPYVKDAFHRYVIDHQHDAVNPAESGSKAAALYDLSIPAGTSVTIHLRLSDQQLADPFGPEVADTWQRRKQEADDFYAALLPGLKEEDRLIHRQALAALLWSKQLYLYDVNAWLHGDPGEPEPAQQRWSGRNATWSSFRARDVISMPDKWEYPWFAAWDWAFHCVVMAMVDSRFAKQQLRLLLSDNFLNLDGQIPAYEWSFSDVNPPVQAWAAWKIYQDERHRTGHADRVFLEEMFHRLLGNYYWWLNREDKTGQGLFQGGFLGLDNIAVFNRSPPEATSSRPMALLGWPCIRSTCC